MRCWHVPDAQPMFGEWKLGQITLKGLVSLYNTLVAKCHSKHIKKIANKCTFRIKKYSM
jgi:hypothetical protein